MQTESHLPTARKDLKRFHDMLLAREPFSFIRFSDGEMEVLRDRYVEIGEGFTVFKGKRISSNFPVFDRKLYDPVAHAAFRRDLMESASKRGKNFFKGVPASHNKMVEDRDYMVKLNGGMSPYLTFADLFLNSNFRKFRREIVPIVSAAPNLAIVANFRAVPAGALSRAIHIPIGDSVFEHHERELANVLALAGQLPADSILLSSASSLSNIVGAKLFDARPDITFLDVGTSLNDLLGLQSITRAYHRLYFASGPRDWLFGIRYRLTREYWIRW